MFTVPSSAAMPLLQFPANGAPSSLNSPPAKSPVPLRRGQSIRASVAAFPEAIPTDCRPKPSLYEILKVSPTASFGEIKAAYRALAKIHHPDQARSGDDDGGREFMEIRDAYERLSDPAVRALYDLSLGRRRMPVGSAGGYYPTRRWETDQCW